MKKILIFLITIQLMGCEQLNIIEDIGFINSVAYDLNTENREEQGKLMVTVDVPQISDTAKDTREVHSVKAHSSKEGRTNISRKSGRKIVSGQLRTILFNRKLAEEGIGELLESLERDPFIGLNVRVLVVEGSGKELLLESYPQHPRTSRYINDLVKKEGQNNIIIDSTIYQFRRDLHDDGIDPFCPIVKKGKGEIIVDGMAFFLDDKYKFKLNPKESRSFKMLKEGFNGNDVTFTYTMEQGDSIWATLNILETKSKIKIESPSEIVITLEVGGHIDEYDGDLDLSVKKSQEKIARAIGEKIENEAKIIVKKLQENGVDGLGLGAYVRNRVGYHEWKEMNWKEAVYPDADIKIKTEVKLKGVGTIK